jgi:N-methylhydantoinase B/oxoprolinase/acetone carboxylase alpha subunit
MPLNQYAILETRYPVILHELLVRKGSGGAGHWRGGAGCVRDIEFRMVLQVSVLTDRRVKVPYGTGFRVDKMGNEARTLGSAKI